MVQDFHVVRCSTCDSFQVQQVKKVNKWICKLCGEKQSLLKEFGRGSGADCRRHVQKLNAMRGAMMEEQEHKNREQQVEAEGDEEPEGEQDDQVRQTQVSRWSKYLDTPEEVEAEEEPEEGNVFMDRQQLHGNNMTDRKRKRSDTPEQFNSSSLMRKPVGRSCTTTSLNHSSPPSLNQSNPLVLSHTIPPSKKKMNLPSQSAGPVSRWTYFLSSDCQVKEEEGPYINGWSQPTGGPTRPCPLHPVSSLFEIKEFSFDNEEILTDPGV